MRVQERAPWNLTADEVRQCRRLTYKDGIMKWYLEQAQEKRSGRVFLVKDGDTVLSWALVAPQFGLPSRHQQVALFYTRSRCRRSGYGSQILRIVRRRYGRVYTFSHNQAASEFFSKRNRKGS